MPIESITFSSGFIVVGVWLLWRAAKGKTVYYGQLGVINRKPPRR